MLTLNEQDKLLMIPGPTPVQREILDAIGEPTISHTSRALAEIIRECQTGLAEIAGAREGRVFIFGGAGTLAQEAALVNLVAPGETVVVCSNGYFGDRFVPMAEAHGIKAERLAAEWGSSVTAAQLAERLDREGVRAVTITHVETSTGVLAPLEELTGVARERGVHVIVDAVCSLAGVPVDMGRLRIDVVLTGAQKALGVPPGLALLAVAPAALERRRSVGRVGAYYADLLNWEASMEDPQVYFSTHAVNLFYALRKGIEIALDEGLETRFERHRALASAFRAGMESLGFTSLTQAPWLAPTMSVLAYPDGIEDEPFRQALARAGVVAAGCLGDFRGRGVRFGHMGNITEVEILRTLAAVEAALADAGGRFEPGAALAAARNQAAPVAAGR